jgi:hypothetical protein
LYACKVLWPNMLHTLIQHAMAHMKIHSLHNIKSRVIPPSIIDDVSVRGHIRDKTHRSY